MQVFIHGYAYARIPNMTISEIHQLFLETSGVSIDTRTIKPENFYVAIKGEKFDGHDFVKDAFDKGAAYALVSDDRLKDDPIFGKHIIVAPDTLEALQELATFHRRQFSVPVIGITGTNGKTTTKELIAAVLGSKYNLIKTEGNLNNHIGVPLTLLSLTQDTEIAIIEMGANKISDIKELCTIAEPSHGIITNIGMAHLEGFGSKEGVARAKGELYAWLRDHAGIIFLNKKDKDLTSLIYTLDPHHFAEEIQYGDESVPENPYLFGEFNKENMRAAAAIGLHFKIKSADIAKSLKQYKPQNMRSQQIKTERDNDIILDAYNANPSSMKAALEAFADIKTDKPKWLILGDMKELGESSRKEHDNVLWEILKYRFSNVILIGEQFSEVHEKSKRYAAFKTKEECLASHFLKTIRRSSILIKGSNSMKMWELTSEL